MNGTKRLTITQAWVSRWKKLSGPLWRFLRYPGSRWGNKWILIPSRRSDSEFAASWNSGKKPLRECINYSKINAERWHGWITCRLAALSHCVLVSSWCSSKIRGNWNSKEQKIQRNQQQTTEQTRAYTLKSKCMSLAWDGGTKGSRMWTCKRWAKWQTWGTPTLGTCELKLHSDSWYVMES
jgi:hypothetical protein